jgi:hypothetical protein
MSDLTDFITESNTPEPEVFEAVVTEDASPGVPVHVVIPDFDPNLNYGPCPWTPIVTTDGIYFPHKGDRATVVQPVAGEPVIASWTPSTDTPDAGISGLSAPTYETSLPGSPVDGQEIYYAADPSNGVIWHLRYRAGASGSYKWEFIGGSALVSEVSGEETRSDSTYGDLATAGPDIVAPLAGDYLISGGCRLYQPTGQQINALVSVKIGTDAASDSDRLVQWVIPGGASANNWGATLGGREIRKNGIAASTTLRMQYRATSTTIVHYSHRVLRAVPIRVG